MSTIVTAESASRESLLFSWNCDSIWSRRSAERLQLMRQQRWASDTRASDAALGLTKLSAWDKGVLL